MDPEHAAPYNKVVAATLGGAFGEILVYALTQAGLDVAPIEAAITVIFVFLFGYFVPERGDVKTP